MPIDSILVSVAVIAMFVAFGGVLIWGDHQTRPKQLARRFDAKRRAF
jgi:hypothetical protein